MSTLSENHWRMPGVFKETMTRTQLRAALLEHPQPFACGRLWRVKSKHLGAGVYEVSFTQANP